MEEEVAVSGQRKGKREHVSSRSKAKATGEKMSGVTKVVVFSCLFPLGLHLPKVEMFLVGLRDETREIRGGQ